MRARVVTTLLSSRWTFFYKFVLPLLVLGGLGFGAWRAFKHPDEVHMPPAMTPDYGWVLIIVIALFAGGIIWWTVASLCRIEIDDDDLLISHYRTEMRVPLASVESISGPSASNPKRYTLTFEEPTEFGRRVTLLPPMAWTLMPLGEPEAVRELRNAWETARRAATRRQ